MGNLGVPKQFICAHCGRDFARQKDYDKHLEDMHSIQAYINKHPEQIHTHGRTPTIREQLEQAAADTKGISEN